VMERVARQDTDKRSLGEMIHDGLKQDGYSTTVLSGTGYHPDIFYHLIKALSCMKHHPRLIVYPVNLRCFSPQWHLNPAWQYHDEIRAIERYQDEKCIVRVKHVSRDKMQDFRNSIVEYPAINLKTVGSFLDTIAAPPVLDGEEQARKKILFIFHYMHPLVPWHQKLVAITMSLFWARKLGMKVLLYLTPVNDQAGVRFVGSKFYSQVNANVEVVGSAVDTCLETGLVRWCDWSTSFDSDQFFYPDLATEHLAQAGRLDLASRIIKSAVNFIRIH